VGVIKTLALIVISFFIAMFIQRLMWSMTYTLIHFMHLAMIWMLVFIVLAFGSRLIPRL